MKYNWNAPNGAFEATHPDDFKGWELLDCHLMENQAKAIRVQMRRLYPQPEFMTVCATSDVLRVAREQHLCT